MNKPLKTITNPMTLIAIFATLSETSAAISLPFLDDQDREYYLWFLISFPFYLLLLFFITLNFNYRSLYSPSDFRKSKHFMKTMDDSNGRRKRIFRRTNKVKRLPIRFHRRKKEPQRVIFLVHKPSEDLIEANRPKRSKHATEHTPIVIYIICSRDSAEVVSDRQDG
ncbi:hypothetical protein PSH74_06235 [Pseudomonas hefeiensis]|uniref:Uncharacterized protein n=2 Tax=Pseudomonas hefeiensis TaxID=2738125 RepID=A0ABY9GE80_9PSED|nr:MULTISPECIES: hypothetical protein [unclassified Pseudomonas]WLH13941.1 hypothetical protein PSH57_06245 [Pseudomonas sp. FP205]WLI41270.1 hypothetical protein PSH74_06235 [Pseudomonas sp. FP821]